MALTILKNWLSALITAKDNKPKMVLSSLFKGTNYISSSIARQARRNICSFPMICSESLNPEHLFKLQQKLESNIATMLLLCIQNGNNFVELNDSQAVAKYIGQFTRSSNFEAFSLRDTAATEGVEIGPDKDIKSAKDFKEVAALTWHLINYDPTESLNMDLLYDDSILWRDDATAFTNGIGAVAPASAPFGEATNGKDYGHNDYVSDIDPDDTDTYHVRKKRPYKSATAHEAPVPVVPNTQSNPVSSPDPTAEDKQRSNSRVTIEKKSDNSAPTIVNAEIILTDAEKKTYHKHSIALGVKTSIHLFGSEELAAAIKDTYSTTSTLARFIRWRAGELSFVKDVLLNLKEIKESVQASHNRYKHTGAKAIFSNMRFRLHNSIMTGAAGINGKVLPTAILVVGRDEVEEVNRSCGKDFFKNMKDARELCAKLGLFGIVILESETESYYSFFNDGAIKFEKKTLRSDKKDSEDKIIKTIFGALRR